MSGRALAARGEDVAGRRDLALAAVTVVGLSRLIEPPAIWLAAIFLLGAILLGTLQVLGDERARIEGPGLGVPVESLILPAVAAAACVGAIRLVPFGLGLAPALLVTGLIVDRCLALEARILASPSGVDAEERTAVLVTTLIVAFLGFVGVAAMIPGGLVQPAPAGGGGGAPLPETDLLVLVGGRRHHRVPARVPGRGPAGVERARRAVVRGDLRGGHRHRRGRRPVHGDPAPARPRAC